MAAPQSQAETAKALGMAQQEMEYRVDLFNRWTRSLLSECFLRSFLWLPDLTFIGLRLAPLNLLTCLYVQDGAGVPREVHRQKVCRQTRRDMTMQARLN